MKSHFSVLGFLFLSFFFFFLQLLYLPRNLYLFTQSNYHSHEFLNIFTLVIIKYCLLISTYQLFCLLISTSLLSLGLLLSLPLTPLLSGLWLKFSCFFSMSSHFWLYTKHCGCYIKETVNSIIFEKNEFCDSKSLHYWQLPHSCEGLLQALLEKAYFNGPLLSGQNP